METSELTWHRDIVSPADIPGQADAHVMPRMERFHDAFVYTFSAHFPKLFRILDRLTGDPDLAADLAQDAFIRLYRRGSLPDRPEAWLISVAMNLLRNASSSRKRRQRLLTLSRAEAVHSDPASSPDDAVIAKDSSRRVRVALDRLTERERSLLLLAAEGYSYRDIVTVLDLNESSVGTLLARARRAFRELHEEGNNAP